MTRLIYIAGKYRHWRGENDPGQETLEFDLEAMAREVEDERAYAARVAAAGHMWIAPLSNSQFLQGVIPEEVFIRRDLEILDRMRPGYDVILLRPGWSVSSGATTERNKANERGLFELHPDDHNHAARLLAEMNGV